MRGAQRALRPAQRALGARAAQWRCLCSGGSVDRGGGVDVPILSEHPANNVPAHVAARVGRNLHRQRAHPLHTIKSIIEEHFSEQAGGGAPFEVFDAMHPVVPVKNNFDDLLIPAAHVSRGPSDTYYVDDAHVLRTHTSAHQSTLLAAGHTRFLATGDVYRRDEIDSSHYPVFHQMEGVRVFEDHELPTGSREERVAAVEADLKASLEGLARKLYGLSEGSSMRWGDDYFPFTEPSFELEIKFEGRWLEVLGCGVVEQQILRDAGHGEKLGWAFGLGLERLAMVLFGIPDIRLFWSEDDRFHKQFQAGRITAFSPYSKYPPVFKDVSFWLPEAAADGTGAFHENDLFEHVRDVSGDLVEQVALIDEFAHPKTGRVSHCYRTTYRSMDRTLTDVEVDALQQATRDALTSELGVELR